MSKDDLSYVRTKMKGILGENYFNTSDRSDLDKTLSSSIPLESDATSTNNGSSSGLSGSELELLFTEELCPEDSKMKEDDNGDNDISEIGKNGFLLKMYCQLLKLRKVTHSLTVNQAVAYLLFKIVLLDMGPLQRNKCSPLISHNLERLP